LNSIFDKRVYMTFLQSLRYLTTLEFCDSSSCIGIKTLTLGSGEGYSMEVLVIKARKKTCQKEKRTTKIIWCMFLRIFCLFCCSARQVYLDIRTFFLRIHLDDSHANTAITKTIAIQIRQSKNNSKYRYSSPKNVLVTRHANG